MTHFFYESHKIRVDTSEIQTSKNNKLFRVAGLAKNCQVPAKWVDGVLKNHWIYYFFMIESKTFIKFEVDYFDKCIGIIK